MVTREQPGLQSDPDVFRALARHHGARFGVWCSVTLTGSVRVNDAVTVTTDHRPRSLTQVAGSGA